MAKLPKEYISVSQINAYINCGYKYYLQYMTDKMTSNITDRTGLILGSAVHKFIEMSFKSILNLDYFVLQVAHEVQHGKFNATSIEELDHAVLQYENDCSEESRRDVLLLLQFIMQEEDYKPLFVGIEEVLKTKTVMRPSLHTIYENICFEFVRNKHDLFNDFHKTSIEKELNHSFSMYNKEYMLKAYLDVVGEDDRNIVIYDWKTTKRAWNAGDARRKQDEIYSYIIWRTTGKIPTFRYVVWSYSQATGDVKQQIFEIQYPESVLSRTEREIFDVIKGIKRNVFYKNESSFLCNKSFCEYWQLCQKHNQDIKIKEL